MCNYLYSCAKIFVRKIISLKTSWKNGMVFHVGNVRWLLGRERDEERMNWVQ